MRPKPHDMHYYERPAGIETVAGSASPGAAAVHLPQSARLHERCSAQVHMEIEDRADRLLERIRVLRHPSDLDLLVFFAKHPHSLLASEHLATFLGYSNKEMAASLDLLVDAGLVTRSQSERHPARMFVFAERDPDRDWFSDLLTIAGTREGRLAILRTLRRRVSGHDAPSEASSAADRPARPVLVGRKPDGGQRTRTG